MHQLPNLSPGTSLTMPSSQASPERPHLGGLTRPSSIFKICQGLNGSWASSRVQTKPTHMDAGSHPGYFLFHA